MHISYERKGIGFIERERKTEGCRNKGKIYWLKKGILFSISIMLMCADSERGFYLLSAVNNALKAYLLCVIIIISNFCVINTSCHH